jgi:Arc/MetJ family transcription regulator
MGEQVGQRNLAVTANSYSHVLADETGLDYAGCPADSLGHTMVYSDTMGRTQIYLGSDELELLDRVARATGASRSELVRRAVRSTFGQPTKADKLEALAASAGTWRGRGFTGSEYVDSVRGDLAERLSLLGLE